MITSHEPLPIAIPMCFAIGLLSCYLAGRFVAWLFNEPSESFGDCVGMGLAWWCIVGMVVAIVSLLVMASVQVYRYGIVWI